MAEAPAIFQSESGEPAKFFLQAELSEDTKQQLTRDIERHGGRVSDKVPLQGFVLIDPRSLGGQRLAARWRTPDKPKRRVVPTNFIRACMLHNGVLPPIFTRYGHPLRMHVHGSVEDQTVRDRAYERIWHSGGDPTVPLVDADVVLVTDDEDKIAAVRSEVAAMRPPPYVESLAWVKQCANSGECKFSPQPKQKPMKTNAKTNGKPNGRGRNEYTPADDHELLKYIAHQFPDATKPGRSGNRLYKDLCDDVETYPWAARHPWSSWRERYIKNRESFDNRISVYCKEHGIKPPADDDKKGKKKRPRKKKPTKSDPTTSGEDSGAGECTDDPQAAKSPRRPRRVERKKASSSEELTPSPTAKAEELTEAKAPSPAPRPHKPLARTSSRDSWGSQWEVRIAPEDDRPEWAKRGRKRSADDAAPDNALPSKKARRDELQPSNSEPREAREVSHPPVVALLDNDSVTEDSASEAEANAVDAIAQPAVATAESTQTQDSSVGTQSEALGETQQLLAAHNAIVGGGRRESPPPLAGPSHAHQTAHDIDAQLSQIAQKYRFYLQDVMTLYDQIQDMPRTEQVFSDMRKAADAALHAHGF